MRFILFFVLLISITGYGQWKSYTISVKGDTLNRVDMKGRKQGPWMIHLDDLRGERGYEEEGYYETGKKKVTKPQAVLDYEKKNADKKKVRTRDGQTGYIPIP